MAIFNWNGEPTTWCQATRQRSQWLLQLLRKHDRTRRTRSHWHGAKIYVYGVLGISVFSSSKRTHLPRQGQGRTRGCHEQVGGCGSFFPAPLRPETFLFSCSVRDPLSIFFPAPIFIGFFYFSFFFLSEIDFCWLEAKHSSFDHPSTFSLASKRKKDVWEGKREMFVCLFVCLFTLNNKELRSQWCIKTKDSKFAFKRQTP